MINMLGYFLGHYPQHFTLTDEQRNLILQTMMFSFWLAGGAGIFARTSNEWQFADALYFCDVTILTVGFGDFYAPNDLTRGLVFPYSVGGIIILGLMVSSIHKFAREMSKDNVIRKHMEVRRQRTLTRVVSPSTDIESSHHSNRNLYPSHNNSSSTSSPSATHRIQTSHQDTFPKDTEDLAPRSFMNRKLRKTPLHQTFKAMSQPVKTLKHVRSRRSKLIMMREEKDRFDAMRAIQKNASNFKKWFALTLSVLAFGFLWCVGALVFWIAEKPTQQLTYFQSLYFCYVSLLTIGYGDLSPKSNAGKPFFVVWSLIAVPTMTILISDMSDTVIAAFKRGTFRIADWTVLPKTGIYHALVRNSPWIRNWVEWKVEKRRIEKGFPIGPDENEEAGPSLEELADPENLSDSELTHRLALAIRKTVSDLKKQKSRRYSYEEWVEFTRLIKFTSRGSKQLEEDEDVDGVIAWDWLGDDSPMLSEQSEAEWVLDRLCESLMRLLKKDDLARLTAPFTSAEPRGDSRMDSASSAAAADQPTS